MKIFPIKFNKIKLNNLRIFITGDGFRYMHKYNKGVLLYLVLFTVCMIVFNVNENYNQAKHTLISLDESYNGYIDKDYYCKSINCRYIATDNTLLDIDNMLVIYDINPDNIIVMGGYIYIGIYSKNIMYYININNNILHALLYSLAVLFFLISTITVFVYYIINDERLNMLFNISNKNTEMQHELLFNMASNVNHEVKSPLLVLRSILNELKEAKPKSRKSCNGCNISCGGNTFLDDFDELIELGNISVQQIYDSLDSLSEYRQINISNDSTSLYSLTEMAIKMLNKTSVNKFMNVYIDDNLKKYTVYNKSGMPNTFYLSTIINHAKNSLEANANTLNINIHDIDSKFLSIYIKDNGDGIPDNVIDHIFDLHYTTKQLSGDSRGTGLYTNNLLISNLYGGSITVIPTEHGATFCLKMKYNTYKNKDMK